VRDVPVGDGDDRAFGIPQVVEHHLQLGAEHAGDDVHEGSKNLELIPRLVGNERA
jgi:hypothetical protein